MLYGKHSYKIKELSATSLHMRLFSMVRGTTQVWPKEASSQR